MPVLKARVGGAWQTVGYGGGITPGGTLGDLLIKVSPTDGDARWGTDPPKLFVASTGTPVLDAVNAALGVGNLVAANIALYSTGIQARSNSAASPLHVNVYGGLVQVGALDATVFPAGLYVSESAHATSRRASVRIGSNWQIMQDLNANGTKELTIYNIGNTAIAAQFNAAGNDLVVPNLHLISASGPRIASDGAYLNFIAASGLGNLYYDIGGSGGNFWRRTSDFASLMTLTNGGALSIASILTTAGRIDCNGNQLNFAAGGGWYMIDGIWVRSVAGKSIYTDGSIACAGNMHVGGSSPAHKLDVNGNIRATGIMLAENPAGSGASAWGSMQDRPTSHVAHPNGVAGITLYVSASGIAPILRAYGNTGEGFHCRSSGDAAYIGINASAFAVNSTLRAKQNVETVDDKVVLDLARQVRPVRFEYNVRPSTIHRVDGKPEVEWPILDHDCAADFCTGTPDDPCSVALNDHPRFGFLAEDMAAVVPEAVELDGDKSPAGIDVAQTASLAFAGVGALLRRIEELEHTIERLQGASL